MALIDKLTAIAREIRNCSNLKGSLTLSDMEMGISEVYDTGVANGLKRGKELGAEAAQTAFWEAVPEVTQKYLFAGPAWNTDTFYPIKSFSFYGDYADYMFAHHNIASSPYDLAQRLEACGVRLDFSGITCANSVFYKCNLTGLPLLDFAGCTKLTGTFAFSQNLRTITALLLGEDCVFDKTFQKCTALENLTVFGTIGQNGLDVSDCPLTQQSLLSILNALKSGVSGLTVTLGESNLAKLTEAEKAIATDKGWVLQ